MLTMVTLKNGYRVKHVNWASSTIDTDTVNAAVKQKGEEEGGKDESEEEKSKEYVSPRISHSMVPQCVGTTRLHASESVRIQ
jgi:preprotein translocase subunit SecF